MLVIFLLPANVMYLSEIYVVFTLELPKMLPISNSDSIIHEDNLMLTLIVNRTCNGVKVIFQAKIMLA